MKPTGDFLITAYFLCDGMASPLLLSSGNHSYYKQLVNNTERGLINEAQMNCSILMRKGHEKRSCPCA